MNMLNDENLVEGTALVAKHEVNCGDFILPKGKKVKILTASDALIVSITFYLFDDDVANEDDVKAKSTISWDYLKNNFVLDDDDDFEGDKSDEGNDDDDDSSDAIWEGNNQAKNVTTKLQAQKEPGTTYYELNCADCGAIQTFRLDSNGLSLVKSIHQC